MKQRQKTRKGREHSVTLKKGKLLLSAAAGEFLQSQVELYESGRVLALVNDPAGQLHLIRNSSHSTRKDISCRSLYGYLRDRFGLEDGGKLSAWYGPGDEALFFGVPEDEREGRAGFHSGFHRVPLPLEQYEPCSVFNDHGVLMLSRAAARRVGDRVRVYQRGDTLCIADDPEGDLEVTLQPHSSKAIASKELVDYLRRLFPGFKGCLPARICGGRVYVSFALPDREQDFSAYRPLHFRMSPTGERITLTRPGVLRVSATAASALSSWVSVYERGTVTALVNDDVARSFCVNRRPKKRGGYIHSAMLRDFLWEKYGGAEKLCFEAKVSDGVIYFSTEPMDDSLKLSDFEFSWVNGMARGTVNLFPNRLYLGDAAAALGEQFSVQPDQEGMALVADAQGGYHRTGRTVNSVELARYLARELGCGPRARLRVDPVPDGVRLTAQTMQGRVVGRQSHLRAGGR